MRLVQMYDLMTRTNIAIIQILILLIKREKTCNKIINFNVG